MLLLLRLPLLLLLGWPMLFGKAFALEYGVRSGLYWDIMEKKMEATTMGDFGYRIWGILGLIFFDSVFLSGPNQLHTRS